MGLTRSRTWLYQNSGDTSNGNCSTSIITLKTLIQISAINEVSSYSLKRKIPILLLECLLSFNTGQVTCSTDVLSYYYRDPQYFIYEWLGVCVFLLLCFVWGFCLGFCFFVCFFNIVPAQGTGDLSLQVSIPVES